MRIMAERGGGVAGPANHERVGPVELASLPSDARDEIQALLREARFFDLPAKLPDDPALRRSDPMWHRVRVDELGKGRTEGGRSHAVAWDDNSKVPPALPRLVEALAQAAGGWTRLAPPRA